MTMSLCEGRYATSCAASVAEGWRLDRLTPASRLFGANGLRTGPDGRIYIAQVTGSQISALDLGTGQLETISAKGGEIIAPDDVDFDLSGDLYATEVMDGRVSVLDTGGRTRVLRDDVPAANGITVHRGRLFIGECRVGGCLVELDLNGGAPRVLLETIPMPNVMEVGPDGMLYFPVIGANEIWRIDPEGVEPQRVALDLGVPSAVKFDSGGYIVSTQVRSGQVLRIDPRSGDRTVLAALNPGLDNLTFVGDRVFVSNGNGEITEILGGGQTRTVLAGGLTWPLDLAMGDDGNRYIADGNSFYVLLPDRTLRIAGMLFTRAIQVSCAVWPQRGRVNSSSPQPGVRFRATGPAAAKAKCWQTVSISSTAWRSERGAPSWSQNSERDVCWQSSRPTLRCWSQGSVIRWVWRLRQTARSSSPNQEPGGWSR
jgi:sugar lactone lactonase YvrE